MKNINKILASALIAGSLGGCMSIEQFAYNTGGEVIYSEREIVNHDPNNNGIPEIVRIYLGDTLTFSYSDKNQDGVPDEIFFGSNNDDLYRASKKNRYSFQNLELRDKKIKNIIGFAPKENGEYTIIGLYTTKDFQHVLKGGWYNLNSGNKPSSFFWGENYDKEYLPKPKEEIKP